MHNHKNNSQNREEIARIAPKDRRVLRAKIGEAIRVVVGEISIEIDLIHKSGQSVNLGFVGPPDMILNRVQGALLPQTDIRGLPVTD